MNRPEKFMSMSEKPKAYIEHFGKAVEADERFKHVMAIALNPASDHEKGVIRCIHSREGDITTPGYIDRSVLHKIHRDSPERFSIGGRLTIKNQDKIVGELSGDGLDFLGPEDPDIWVDEEAGLVHLYFTMPFRDRAEDRTLVHLGHAVGEDMDSLKMTQPVLMGRGRGGAKEVSIAPANKRGFRYNLIESSREEKDFTYSTIRTAVARDMGKAWEYGETVFHPAESNIPWIGGHASPGPLLPKSFLDVGEGKMLGIINGREANRKAGNEIKYGIFSVGLFIYDYENGKIEWVSPEPFIRDSEARTITFASQFVETKKGEGVLYAHVDDSFVRAYTLNAEAIKSLLP
ncbi:MAG: hypothetical protein Q8P49_02190 [Candidatus Liptonbacteria bacterium]|nr:hypothetical protein [Candidatus Liptonbacteria bacterium]